MYLVISRAFTLKLHNAYEKHWQANNLGPGKGLSEQILFLYAMAGILQAEVPAVRKMSSYISQFPTLSPSPAARFTFFKRTSSR